MKFICLHGSGTNNNVMKLQTASLRHELEDDEHEFEFVEAIIECSMDPGVEVLASPGERFYAWFDPDNLTTLTQCIGQLENYIATEGPFDSVIGFSAGAVLAAMYIIKKQRMGGSPPFRCAIFLSSGPNATEQDYLHVRSHVDLLQIPTAHIWGSNDTVAPNGGKDLSQLCRPDMRSVFIHGGGHEVPRKDDLIEAVHVIRRTIYQAT